MDTIAVAVQASDPITQQGAVAKLSSYRGISLVPADELHRCEVLLVLVGEVTEATLFLMQSVYQQRGADGLSVVLVANSIQEQQVLRAVNCGLVSLLFRQETGFDRIVDAVTAAKAGRSQLPGAVVRYLIDQIRAVQRDVLALHGVSVNGLATREIEVLKLIADGMDTGDVAVQLNYSERTVKNIIHGIVTRLKLRNRTHAVAYAMRCGML